MGRRVAHQAVLRDPVRAVIHTGIPRHARAM